MPQSTVAIAAGTAVLTAFLSLPASAGMDTYPRQPGLVITGYAFDITLSDASDEIAVLETVQARMPLPPTGG